MLIPNQLIEVGWHSQSKEHYIDKGYVFTKIKDKFFVKAEDLTKSSTAKVKVKCDYCNEEYSITWYHYQYDILDKNRLCACYNCRHKKRYTNDVSQRQEKLYLDALNVCNTKGYVLLTQKEDIVKNTSFIKYSCPIHGMHKMRIANLINGKSCPDCNLEKLRKDYRLSSDEVERRIMELGSKILNKDSYINSQTKNLQIVCKECGAVFTTSFAHFINHNGQVCEKCRNSESKGERKIRHYLELHNINFIQEKTFCDCKDIRPLPFDFYLPEYNMCIEFDGEQHYRDKGNFSNSLKYTQHHDEIKTKYCNDNGIHLLRIPYWHYDNIDKILDKNIISHKDIV